MKYKKYISTFFLALLLLPVVSAKKATVPVAEFDLGTVNFIEKIEEIELGFDTSMYLPEDFDAYGDILPIGSINFLEDDTIELGFDTAEYLPEDFNAYE